MQLLYPEKHMTELQQRLEQHPEAWWLICFCAAWCRTCAGFEEVLEQFASSHPEVVCVWVDIEEHEELLLDDDLLDLPTFALQKAGHTYFYAPLPPMIEHVQRLYQQAEKQLLPPLDDTTYPIFTQLLP